MLHFSPNYRRGFTLIEIIIVMGILGLLLTMGLASYQASQRAARDSRRKVDLEIIAQALEIYKSDIGQYPATLSTLTPNYIRTVPVDPQNVSPQVYTFAPVCSGSATICGVLRNCASSCCAYQISVTLEAGTTQTVCNP